MRKCNPRSPSKFKARQWWRAALLLQDLATSQLALAQKIGEQQRQHSLSYEAGILVAVLKSRKRHHGDSTGHRRPSV